MNPDRNTGAWTVDALMQAGLGGSMIAPIVAFIVLGFVTSASLAQSQWVLLLAFAAIFVLFCVFVVNYAMQRKIKGRIAELTEVCFEYTGGNREVRAVVNGDDEFARLAMAVNTLLDNQSHVIGGATLSGGGSGGSDAAALQAQIEKLLQEVSAVGDGDLRVQAEVTPDTLGVLADSFNYMIEELAKVVGRVQSTAVQVTNATRRILDGSAELAQASETQVAQISQTTEAVEALANFIQNVARDAQMSAEVAQEALGSAQSGQQAVRQTIEGMMLIRENVQETAKKIKRLGERSNEIGEIVRIIEDIADQTNLLALNAAIQSAMAGEHGRGFAVVADEIRLLAERSTESTKRIATLVKSIQGDTYEAVVAMEDSTQEVVKGSQLADEAGHSLNSIYGAVERQAQMIEGIARAANEQTSVSEAVAVAMGRISEITRQTDASTQEAAVSVSYLAELAEQLRASVSTFRLPERSNGMLDSFTQMTSVSEFASNGEDQGFAQPMLQGADAQWDQGFGGNFPPLPEPGNTAGSLVALGSRPGQFGLNNQQDFGNPPGLGTQQFGNQPAYNNQQFNNVQQGFGEPSFASQQFDYGDLDSLENQANFGANGFGGQQFNAPPMGGPGQSYFLGPEQVPASPGVNPGSLPQAPQLGQGPATPSRQRWPGGPQAPQQGQGQFSFNQDQLPYQNKG
jgi:methyl-accepting chemotaxis protein